MGRFWIMTPLLIAFAFPANPQSDSAMPMMRSVAPAAARAGGEVVAQGTNLGKDYVAALYLTDGKSDVKVAILEQTPTAIRFKIPLEAKPGRVALMVLTAGREAKLIEEPVKLEVEAGIT